MALPVTYTEIIGATIYPYETEKAWYFEFGGAVYFTSKSKSKWEDDKLYVETWAAKENARRWKGKFINRWRMMEPIDDTIMADVDEATRLLKSGQEKVSEGNDEIRRALAILQRHEATELDAATAKIMQVIGRT